MSAEPASDQLVRLADRRGVATDYWDWQQHHVRVPAPTLVAVLDALGVDASDDDAVARAHRDLDDAPWRRTLPPTVVTRAGWTPWVAVHVPHGTGVALHVELEGGGRRRVRQLDHWVEPREVDGELVGEATFELDADLPLGWHRLVAEVEGRDPQDDPTASATLVVTPQKLELPDTLGERGTGLAAQLYQVRSARSWGIGDLADLREISRWAAADLDADFVLINPLHASDPIAPIEPSPYLPSTRSFVSPLYIAVDEVPELDGADGLTRASVLALAAEGHRLHADDTVDRDAVWRVKSEALELLHRLPRSADRQADLDDLVEARGEALVRWARWCAIAEVHGATWPEWPAELRSPTSPAVEEFALAHADRVDLHLWLQLLADEQLGATQAAATDAGMGLGILHDLAVGVHPEGADAWALPDVLARGVTVGAPPDQFTQKGQNWSQPPWHPTRLAEAGYGPYRDMVRAILAHAGGIRVDHVIGLFRLWWIPEDQEPSAGTYVRYDHEALVGILALEAHRAGAVLVGEDLGVVEPWVRDHLRERGILGTSIVWFEHDGAGAVILPANYRELCLATVTTHDLPPTEGFLDLVHVDLRDDLGQLTRPVEEERADEEAAHRLMAAALRAEGVLGADEPLQGARGVRALHAYVARTPSRLLAYALTDLVGDRRPINQPGTHREYPNWSLALTGADGRVLALEDVPRTVAERDVVPRRT